MRKFLLCFFLAGCAGGRSPAGVSAQTLNVADAALRAGNPALALHVSRAVLNHDPADRNAKLHEAAALYALGRESTAQSIYEQLYFSRPTTEAAVGLAKCLLRKDPRRAAMLFKFAVSRAPNNIGFLTDFGVAWDFAGDHNAAQAIYRRTLEIDPSQVPAQADLALSLALSGNFEKAANMLRPLAQAGDSTARIRQDYGAVLSLSGHPNQGANALAADLPLEQAYKAAIDYEALEPPTS